MIKVDSHGRQLHRQLYRLLDVFIQLKHVGYARVLFMHLCILRHLKKVHHPVMELFLKNPATLNEESGELTLSVLARLSCQDSHKSMISHMRELYILSRFAATLHSRLSTESDLLPPRRRRKFIDSEGMEVVTTSAFISRVAHQVRDNTFEVPVLRKLVGAISMFLQK